MPNCAWYSRTERTRARKTGSRSADGTPLLRNMRKMFMRLEAFFTRMLTLSFHFRWSLKVTPSTLNDDTMLSGFPLICRETS
jgi:hypothetical protein